MFSEALVNAKNQVGQCKTCFHLTSGEQCEICLDNQRNKNLICVVAESRDLLALERTREYKGIYHVIGGLISPMDGIGPEMLEISTLVKRVNKELKILFVSLPNQEICLLLRELESTKVFIM